jgi:hypothetical protein
LSNLGEGREERKSNRDQLLGEKGEEIVIEEESTLKNPPSNPCYLEV